MSACACNSLCEVSLFSHYLYLSVSLRQSDDLPLRLTTDKVVLSHTSIESSIIVSTCWELAVGAEPSEEDRIPVAIPINLDIEVGG